MTQQLDVKPRYREQIERLLREHLPGVEVWAYGSRVNGRSHEGSDLDLVLRGPGLAKIDTTQLAEFNEAVQESTIPFLVEARDWARLPESFHREIEREYVVLVEKEEQGGGEKWDTATVADLQRDGVLLVEDGNHGEYRPRRDEFVTEGVAFIRAADMDAGRVLIDSASKINDIARQRIKKGIGAPGDVLLSHKGTVGKVALAPDDVPPFVCSPQTTFWRCLDESILDRRYLYAFLRSPAFSLQLAARAGETDMAPYVSLTSQRTLKVALPPLPEQRVIARILGSLDDKIELNRRMNETLEEIARALFKSWFVDFDPVHAKAALRNHATNRSPLDWTVERAQAYLDGMDPGIAALFPDRFVDSELGEIPEGWEVKPLDTIAVFQNGLALQKFRPQEDEEWLPVVKIAQLRSGKADSGERSTANIRPECIIDDGDIVFSWSGSLTVKVWCGGRAALNQHLFKVTSVNFPKWFFMHCVCSHLGDFQTIAAGKATTMGHIKRHHLSEAMCVVPNGELLTESDGLFSTLLERNISANIQSRALITLRDTLLPKLISGELRVKDSGRFLESVS